MYPKLLSDSSGFTLIEVLITLVIFAVGILGLALMQISAIKGNSVANRVTEAANIASDQIEQIFSWDYNDNRLEEDTNGTYTLTNGADQVADGHRLDAGGNYDIIWNVQENTPVADSKTVAVTVIWFDKGQSKALILSTIKTP
ncbi:type IV pilus modification PilV family protein [Desulfuromonas acetexigens]|jgi:type IV pilus assembly protein PilV|uniref:Prepilin-type N-terminal cleavage/methylation domain-containing protein n=1 Tax=Trichloromonas acetexigens TaxID=38815 RepID=A0A550JAM8_9BACT|nr:prepilin-type N-terminal cleavage/methylation domain-containing protein [Desulfuromonas acetexigens]TRO80310.1 prepilin-type N-terminal cleavage/methylation domain-containing protein [Desulfuromonas acetexigens]